VAAALVCRAPCQGSVAARGWMSMKVRCARQHSVSHIDGGEKPHEDRESASDHRTTCTSCAKAPRLSTILPSVAGRSDWAPRFKCGQLRTAIPAEIFFSDSVGRGPLLFFTGNLQKPREIWPQLRISRAT
jgi:cytochrome c5